MVLYSRTIKYPLPTQIKRHSVLQWAIFLVNFHRQHTHLCHKQRMLIHPQDDYQVSACTCGNHHNFSISPLDHSFSACLSTALCISSKLVYVFNNQRSSDEINATCCELESLFFFLLKQSFIIKKLWLIWTLKTSFFWNPLEFFSLLFFLQSYRILGSSYRNPPTFGQNSGLLVRFPVYLNKVWLSLCLDGFSLDLSHSP